MKIVRTTLFQRDLKRLGLSATEAGAIEDTIAANPTAGDLIQGLGGLRKIRFGMAGRGKSGGGRAIYYLMLADDVAILITAFSKKEKADLSPADRKAILRLMKELEL